MIEDDEIMSELRQIREEMLAESGSDPDTRYRMMLALEAEEARKGRRIVSLPPRPAGDSALAPSTRSANAPFPPG